MELPDSGARIDPTNFKERTERLLKGSLSQLTCSDVSLQELADALSAKTGLKFLLDKGIQGHVFSLQCNGRSVEDVLGTLCRINHWRKSVLKDGSIYIAWQFLQKNRMEIQEDIRALREGVVASIPPSLASFLGIGINGDGIVPPFVVPEELKNQFFPVQEPPRRRRAMGVVSGRGSPRGIGESKLQTLKWGEIPQELDGKAEVSFTHWSNKTKHTVCEFIVRSSVSWMTWSFGDWTLSGYEDRTLVTHPESFLIWQKGDSKKDSKISLCFSDDPSRANKDDIGDFMLITDFLSPLREDEKKLIQEITGN